MVLSLLLLIGGEFFLTRLFVRTTLESPLLWVNRHYYREFDRALLQYDEHCMVTDPIVGYRLNTDGCTFKNREFTTTISANSRGLRDDERSLHAPEVIVVGDSHAMGWGVEGNETFAQTLEQQLRGVTVLNAAIASYGTARELLLLRELDISRLQTLIIQYNSSDQGENEAFLDDPARFSNDVLRRFGESKREYDQFNRLAPGNFLIRHLPLVLQHLQNPERFTRTPFWKKSAHEATLFLRVLDALLPRTNTFDILVLDVTGHNQNTKDFIEEVLLQNRGDRGAISIIDLKPVLTENDYFVLDDHINARGHAKIATAILEKLRNSQTTTKTH